MDKQKSPNTSRNQFAEKAEIPVVLALEIRVSKLPENKQKDFYNRVAKQQRNRDRFVDELIAKRDEKIKDHARKLVDKAVTENKPTLKPKFFQTPSSQIEEQARIDATLAVQQEEVQRINDFDARCVEAQINFLIGAEHAQELLENFRETNKELYTGKDGQGR